MKFSHWIIRGGYIFKGRWQKFYFSKLQWKKTNRFNEFPPHDLTDILDLSISRIRAGVVDVKQLQRRVFGIGTQVNLHLSDLLDAGLKSLESDGFITHLKGNYQITYKGEMFWRETINTPYFGRPYRLMQVRNKLKSIWLIIKIIAGLANALAIIYLGFMQIQKPDEKPQTINYYYINPSNKSNDSIISSRTESILDTSSVNRDSVSLP